MDRGNGNDMGAVFGIKIVQIGDMLEVVRPAGTVLYYILGTT